MAHYRPTSSPVIPRNHYSHYVSLSPQSHYGPKKPRKAYSLARSLPNEIVVRICRTYVKELYVESNVCRQDVIEEGPLLLRSIINMSHVCRHWRSFIINDPSLWCHFVNPHHRNHRWTRLLLERSKPLPITYATISPDFIVNKNVFERELAYADKLSSYSVAFDLNCKVWYDNHIPDKWPRLRSLCIAHFTFDDADFRKVDSGTESDEDSDDTDYDGEGNLIRRKLGYAYDPRFIRDNTKFLLMPKYFPSRQATPHLERLHLHTCSLQSISQITGLTRLTELHVSNTRYWSAFEWVTVLSRLPCLRNVALDRVISNQRLKKEDAQSRSRLSFDSFYLRDDICLCAQFLVLADLKSNRVFQLMCDETQNDTENYTRLVFSRVSSIVKRLITTNPLFSNCALQIGHGSIEILGYPDDQDLEDLPGDSIGTSGPSTFSGAVVELDFFCGDKKSQDVLSKWMELFRPLFGNIDSLLFRDDDNNSGMILDDTWLSDLLWASSHRLSEIIAINQRGWKTICQNMFSKANAQHRSKTTQRHQRSNNTFLKALTRLELWTSPSPVGSKFKDSVVAFCREKQAMGAPLKCIRPKIIPADGDLGRRDCEDLTKQLQRIGVPVDTNYYSDSDDDED
ncbi:hypothetical protein AGABI1DRAFT_125765 [Agaricus bisporus var. burnettii JB137-S8]|uniref:Uncharacterized protein n=1 Tax=Agaricus bisporus var. burnettii (strain JB137-S8 / ATCC MYA-4627 / FGSC 10392) TaxID=597362 RepID=K5Y5D1_AGABU|nr:uncharacterized protein AGABI1DRAFT_125765 [Agaricus bisporus var. burnettii JB137-S8]EKM83310.1 hypothetical protein AGABI1DRAFT_125765 [Agaricus bisporus var. burnettii JB137-S8]